MSECSLTLGRENSSCTMAVTATLWAESSSTLALTNGSQTCNNAWHNPWRTRGLLATTWFRSACGASLDSTARSHAPLSYSIFSNMRATTTSIWSICAAGLVAATIAVAKLTYMRRYCSQYWQNGAAKTAALAFAFHVHDLNDDNRCDGRTTTTTPLLTTTTTIMQTLIMPHFSIHFLNLLIILNLWLRMRSRILPSF